ncbi:hypothetical protein V7S43_011414 [Phytophthora oleae]|uniref:Uncharacterized protein n=1 Tax=Phytophthora oleae TaxID=2107226 RepID=A0ABD3F9K6_9STRA
MCLLKLSYRLKELSTTVATLVVDPGFIRVVPPSQTQILVQQNARYERSDNATLSESTDVLSSLSPLAPRRRQSRENQQLQPRASRRIQPWEHQQHQSPAPRQIQSRERHRQVYFSVPPRLLSREHHHQTQHHPKPARTNEMQRLVEGLQREVAVRADLAARR